MYDQVVSGVADIAGKIKVGPGLDPVTEMGPLVSDEQFNRVTGYIEDGLRSGARAAAGGNRVGNLGYFVAPTVLDKTTARYEGDPRGNLRAGRMCPAVRR